MTTFEIDIPALSRGLLDRGEDVRTPDRVMQAWSSAKVLAIGPGGELPVTTDAACARLELAPATAFGAGPPDGAVLLGSLGGIHHWAVLAPDPDGTGQRAGAVADGGASGLTIRNVGPLLSDDEAALATTAVALVGWHLSSPFCSRCGRPTRPDLTGHSRICPAGHQEFPRTDPAVIVLVHDGDGNAVLARQPSWAPRRFSVLAGFAEAGESLEATVFREVGEEIGVPVADVEYLGSQPWPFPRSLMIAFAARAPAGSILRPRPGEIEQARWFSRERLQALLDRGEPSPDVLLPSGVSIARRMVEGFVRAG